jgi:hypothetical protein
MEHRAKQEKDTPKVVDKTPKTIKKTKPKQ